MSWLRAVGEWALSLFLGVAGVGTVLKSIRWGAEGAARWLRLKERKERLGDERDARKRVEGLVVDIDEGGRDAEARLNRWLAAGRAGRLRDLLPDDDEDAGD
jgi:hypothetical protein